MVPIAAAQRPYQVVVWGASGFTGRLVCEHIARDYQGKIRWAMAGRDTKKLEKVRSELAKINPACQGPSEELRRTGFWRMDLVAVTEEATPRVVRGWCGDRRDAGYWSTSRMLLETGLCLVLDAPRLAADPRLRTGGVLTPAAACGDVLLERLRAAGFTFEVTGVDGAAGAGAVKEAAKGAVKEKEAAGAAR
ncbi:hypothetical protein TSOC_006386 [Tetrabaena socialis]|uniref:Saccharopine dehydrogenase NADP binding domain-containing protein n=1 Tax=Tetrabaena socialis TaxID=47790 RepID=A0A2J8A3T0_9CHLO|nr:hypothetical protein TSOC_006386 [Tetrabaena socialis]|eukprot:PNH07171.1 hypothetical protein TSOC_006386 [Tetrabaena socialis]